MNIYAAGKEKPVVNANYYPDTDGPFLKWIGKLKTITGDVDHIVARANNEKFSVDSKYDPYRQYGKFPGKARPTSNPPTAGNVQ